VDEASTVVLKRYFKDYYFKSGERIKSPSEIESREFGYFPFGGQMVRHLTFKNLGALRATLLKEVPAGVYCSNSLYTDPTAEMPKKGWIRAELIFDIDADPLGLPCKKLHDIWLCKQCGKKEYGTRPEKCPSCGGTRILEMSWACRECLEGTKKETFKLLDFLESDFGISGKEIFVYFSGNAGYHVHVIGSALEELDQTMRAQISDYLGAKGMLPGAFSSPNLSPNDPGWRGRVARRIRDLPEQNRLFRSVPYEERLREAINKFSKKNGGEKFLEELVSGLAVKIDPMVTSDIHRIFRMPETLNNKTGLVKREVRDLSSFDPAVEAIALQNGSRDEEIGISIDMSPQIELGGRTYGPFRNEKLKLPAFAAVYLIAKGAARAGEAPASEKKNIKLASQSE
jgi:DNA primase small subunit